jgi:hypothetical protein
VLSGCFIVLSIELFTSSRSLRGLREPESRRRGEVELEPLRVECSGLLDLGSNSLKKRLFRFVLDKLKSSSLSSSSLRTIKIHK